MSDPQGKIPSLLVVVPVGGGGGGLGGSGSGGGGRSLKRSSEQLDGEALLAAASHNDAVKIRDLVQVSCDPCVGWEGVCHRSKKINGWACAPHPSSSPRLPSFSHQRIARRALLIGGVIPSFRKQSVLRQLTCHSHRIPPPPHKTERSSRRLGRLHGWRRADGPAPSGDCGARGRRTIADRLGRGFEQGQRHQLCYAPPFGRYDKLGAVCKPFLRQSFTHACPTHTHPQPWGGARASASFK
jgi:hypothetical protein